MTTRKCKDCGNQVSKRAKQCPQCGAHVKKKKGYLGVVGLRFLVAVVIGIISSALDDGSSSPPAQPAAAPETKQGPTPPPSAPAKPVAKPQREPKPEPETPPPAEPAVPDWRARQAELKAQYLPEFKPPKVGSQISLTLKGGATQQGVVKSLTDSEIQIEHGAAMLGFAQSQLSTASRIRCFASDYATHKAFEHTKVEKDAFEVRERARKAEIEAKYKAEEEAALISQKSRETGFADGYLVGKKDAWEGRDRDWRNDKRKMRMAKIHSSAHTGDQEKYASGYHHGYNEGWQAAKSAGAPVQ